MSASTAARSPRAPLLSQAAIAAEYGVSRIPVRDALQVLATDGFVELRGTTAVVTPLSVDALQELYELRGAVEPLATRYGVSGVGRAELNADASAARRHGATPPPRRRSGWRPTRRSTPWSTAAPGGRG